jgi:hypothetical protein
MGKKNKVAFCVLFNFIKENIKTKPKNVIFDFELDDISAISVFFPTLFISSCFFNFSQCLWLKVKTDMMSVFYKANFKFRVYLKMIVSLAFYLLMLLFKKKNFLIIFQC